MSLHVGTDSCKIFVGRTTFEYPVEQTIGYCELIVSELVPDWLPVFDVRIPAGFSAPRSVYGETLYSQERPAYMLGLLRGWATNARNGIYSFGFNLDTDLRSDALAFQHALDEAAQRAVTLREKFLKQDGYLPVFVYVGNFASGVVCDRRVQGQGVQKVGKKRHASAAQTGA